MSYPINYPTPQGANVQIFYAGSPSANITQWTKPQGASFVWFTLIGAGGSGNNTNGGGSGAVTNFMCPAFLIPDSLVVSAAIAGSTNSQVRYQQKNGGGYQLLVANSASTITGGTASTANAFTAMGFFQSVAGQNGSSVSQTASATTFLSGGGTTPITNANYGYSANGNVVFFQMQPIIVGIGGTGGGNGGIGCGGGSSANSVGGKGMVVIITW